jgi:hypothetical protein
VLKMNDQPGAQAAGQVGALLSRRVGRGRALPGVDVKEAALRRSRRGREGAEGPRLLSHAVLRHLMEGMSTEVYREWGVVAGP